MSVATPPPLSQAAAEPPDHIVLDGISWDFYERTLEEAGTTATCASPTTGEHSR